MLRTAPRREIAKVESVSRPFMPVNATKGFAPDGQEIKTRGIRQHQVDHTGLGQAVRIQGGEHSGMDVRLKGCQNLLRCHCAVS